MNEEAEGQGFRRVFLFIPVSVIPPMPRTHWIIYHRRHVLSETDSFFKWKLKQGKFSKNQIIHVNYEGKFLFYSHYYTAILVFL